MMAYSVYVIISPLTGRPIYVGRTGDKPQNRLKAHKQEAVTCVCSSRPISLWIRGMYSIKMDAEIEIRTIAEYSGLSESKIAEDRFIEEYMKKFNLLNITRLSGGKRPRSCGGIIKPQKKLKAIA